MEDWAQRGWDLLTTFGVKLITAIIILVVGRWVVGLISRSIRRLMVKRESEPALISFIGSLVRILLMAFVVIAALGQLGIQTTSLVAILGAAGLAIGLALQGSLANFAAGVLMLIFKPFKVGDYITAGGESGTVEEIRIFTTHLKSPDNRAIIIPNAQITSGSITNFSAKDTRRVDLVFGIGYDDDIKKAKDVISDILAKDERVLKDPAPTIALSELADSSVNFVVRPWVKSADYWAVFFDVNEAVKLRFDAEGIGIPFPQRDVHLYQK
jgi:small conductance mechanosensitive channel